MRIEPEVSLTWPEILQAASVGVMRRVNAVRNRREEPYGERPKASWTDDINGAIAELAVAKHFNVFWSGTVGRVDLPDVGRLQVRSKLQDDHRLVVRANDGDDEPVISVLVDLPICRICGWMIAKDAKRHEWLLSDPSKPDRYFVPNAELRAISDLTAEHANERANDDQQTASEFALAR
jgi:hypothetical protein